MEALMCALFIIVQCIQVLFRHMLRTRLSRSVSAGLFNGLSILLSCGRIVVTVATRTQSASRSDVHCSHPDPVCIQVRWWRQLYSPECQRRPCQLDEPQRQIPSEGLINYTATGTKPQQRQ